MEDFTRNKRERDEAGELPEEKRSRLEQLLEVLDDFADAGGEEDIASVMRSLEEEIGLPVEAEETALLEEMLLPTDLGYLLEASDDDLGLPPTVPSSEGGRDEEEPGFGRIWGWADEMPGCDDGMGFAAYGIEEVGSMVVDVDDGLFEYSGMVYASADAELVEVSWRQETLPAV
ncbi:hypothetical protein HPP92_000193 [Vanilla planifolia]|uniref:Uncharacterized protein n=1 Tax=Vanilla planifolia TaxID=51239 RepID=A0A835RXJ2_VANPL|nr:hypothetical protein HPP92_000193 [Vanilla planifolia]